MIDQLKSRNDAYSYRPRTDKFTSYLEQKKETSRNRRQIISRIRERRNGGAPNGKETFVECRDEAMDENTGRDDVHLGTGRDDAEKLNSTASESSATSPSNSFYSVNENNLPISKRLVHASRHSRLKAARRSSIESMSSSYLTNPSKSRQVSKSNSSGEPLNSISANRRKLSAESKSSGDKSSEYKQVRFSDDKVEKKIIYKNEDLKLSKHQSMKTLTSKGLKEEVSKKTKGVDLGVAPVVAMISNIIFGPDKQEPKRIGITIEYDKDDETVQSEITFIHNGRLVR